jgi:hypothetical protein
MVGGARWLSLTIMWVKIVLYCHVLHGWRRLDCRVKKERSVRIYATG